MNKVKIIRLAFLALCLVALVHILLAENKNNYLAAIPGAPLALFVFHEVVLRPRMKKQTDNK